MKQGMKIIEGMYPKRGIIDINSYSSNDEIRFKAVRTKNPVTRSVYNQILKSRPLSAIMDQGYFNYKSKPIEWLKLIKKQPFFKAKKKPVIKWKNLITKQLYFGEPVRGIKLKNGIMLYMC